MMIKGKNLNKYINKIYEIIIFSQLVILFNEIKIIIIN